MPLPRDVSVPSDAAGMRVLVFPTRAEMSMAAAHHAATSIRSAIAARGRARVVAATGASQLEFLAVLTRLPDLDWKRVELFHLDEYIGLSASHRASFRRVLTEHLVAPTGIARFHGLDVDDDTSAVASISEQVASAPIDVLFAGIGENGHLAFNDPPADFVTTEPYIVVTLDEACRRQQVGEGWFRDLGEVPRTAVSMSIQQILKANELIVVVPDDRKAHAVRASLESPISPDVPATALRLHPRVTLYLDEAAASELRTQN
jgi:glucosamine-6-phosphate deaminase